MRGFGALVVIMLALAGSCLGGAPPVGGRMVYVDEPLPGDIRDDKYGACPDMTAAAAEAPAVADPGEDPLMAEMRTRHRIVVDADRYVLGIDGIRLNTASFAVNVEHKDLVSSLVLAGQAGEDHAVVDLRITGVHLQQKQSDRHGTHKMMPKYLDYEYASVSVELAITTKGKYSWAESREAGHPVFKVNDRAARDPLNDIEVRLTNVRWKLGPASGKMSARSSVLKGLGSFIDGLLKAAERGIQKEIGKGVKCFLRHQQPSFFGLIHDAEAQRRIDQRAGPSHQPASPAPFLSVNVVGGGKLLGDWSHAAVVNTATTVGLDVPTAPLVAFLINQVQSLQSLSDEAVEPANLSPTARANRRIIKELLRTLMLDSRDLEVVLAYLNNTTFTKEIGHSAYLALLRGFALSLVGHGSGESPADLEVTVLADRVEFTGDSLSRAAGAPPAGVPVDLFLKGGIRKQHREYIARLCQEEHARNSPELIMRCVKEGEALNKDKVLMDPATFDQVLNSRRYTMEGRLNHRMAGFNFAAKLGPDQWRRLAQGVCSNGDNLCQDSVGMFGHYLNVNPVYLRVSTPDSQPKATGRPWDGDRRRGVEMSQHNTAVNLVVEHRGVINVGVVVAMAVNPEAYMDRATTAGGVDQALIDAIADIGANFLGGAAGAAASAAPPAGAPVAAPVQRTWRRDPFRFAWLGSELRVPAPRKPQRGAPPVAPRRKEL